MTARAAHSRERPVVNLEPCSRLADAQILAAIESIQAHVKKDVVVSSSDAIQKDLGAKSDKDREIAPAPMFGRGDAAVKSAPVTGQYCDRCAGRWVRSGRRPSPLTTRVVEFKLIS
jgi:hypothetical protein